jgi:hypothetical protein
MTEFAPSSNHAARRVTCPIPLAVVEPKVLKDVTDANV